MTGTFRPTSGPDRRSLTQTSGRPSHPPCVRARRRPPARCDVTHRRAYRVSSAQPTGMSFTALGAKTGGGPSQEVRTLPPRAPLKAVRRDGRGLSGDPREDATESAGVGAAIEAFAAHIGCSPKIRTHPGYTDTPAARSVAAVGRDRHRPHGQPERGSWWWVGVAAIRRLLGIGTKANGAGVSSAVLRERSSKRSSRWRSVPLSPDPERWHHHRHDRIRRETRTVMLARRMPRQHSPMGPERGARQAPRGLPAWLGVVFCLAVTRSRSAQAGAGRDNRRGAARGEQRNEKCR